MAFQNICDKKKKKKKLKILWENIFETPKLQINELDIT
mgnify:CR=1 FL=1